MDEHARQVVHSRKATGGHDFWQTPLKVLEPVRQMRPGLPTIDFDPCGGEGDIVHALRRVLPPSDGLEASWRGQGLVFVNPPYSNIKFWSQRAVEEGAHLDFHDQIIFLCPARTDTRWWHESAWKAQAICFWKGRVPFYDPIEKKTGPAPFPSALLYWGFQPSLFREIFSKHGYVVTP